MKNKISFYTLKNIDQLPQFQKLPKEKQEEVKVVASVLPFKVNNYVADNLIDWDNFEKDPLFILTFMQRDMLKDHHYQEIAKVARENNFEQNEQVMSVVNKIRFELNPHPSGQLTSNVPKFNDEPVPGIQHKYVETVLVFPRQGQTCHSYCTFCFRWPQFINMNNLKFATDVPRTYFEYLKSKKNITDVLITGGDPMVMNVKVLKSYIEPLLTDQYRHISNIRIGSKSLTYWPQRYLNDPDTDEVLGLFEKVTKSGKTLSFMAHFNHFREVEAPQTQMAIQRIRSTGAMIRSQSPLLKHINNQSSIWIRNWESQVKQGVVPYYMFIERDTGPQDYFALSLEECHDIYKNAISRVSGLCRTARGPSMSAHPGKICVEDIQVIGGEKVMILKFLQARNPDWVGKLFYAKYDPKAKWLTDLVPAFGQQQFFFDKKEEDIFRPVLGQASILKNTGITPIAK